MKAKVIILEKDDINRTKLSRAVETSSKLYLREQFSCADDLLEKVVSLTPDLVLIGLDHCFFHVETAKTIKRKIKGIKVVLMNDKMTDHVKSKIKTAFVPDGYVSLNSDLDKELDFCYSLLTDQNCNEKKMEKKDQEQLKIKSSVIKDFSSRELEVIKYYTSGYTYSEIADILGISKETVKTHLKNIFKKAKVNKKSQLVIYFKKRRRKISLI